MCIYLYAYYMYLCTQNMFGIQKKALLLHLQHGFILGDFPLPYGFVNVTVVNLQNMCHNRVLMCANELMLC